MKTIISLLCSTVMLDSIRQLVAFVPVVHPQQQRGISEMFFGAPSAMTTDQLHAKEVFESFDKDQNGFIDVDELRALIRSLDIDASPEEAEMLFRYLQVHSNNDNGDDGVALDDFLPWYQEAADAAKVSASNFQQILQSRRTIHRFDKTPVDDAVLRRAVQCAIAAPNRRGTEPWRFIQLGPETIAKVAALKESLDEQQPAQEKDATLDASSSSFHQQWSDIPNWVVVTYQLALGDQDLQRENFKSVTCAVQNFMLSMWSEGVGSKWTDGPLQRTTNFADLCGVDLSQERVAGVLWFGWAQGGLTEAAPKQKRRKGVDDVLNVLP